MQLSRQYVLGGVLVLLSLLTAVLLADVLATVFFAITVAYLLFPLRVALSDRGLSPWAASVVATVTAFVGIVAVTAPLVLVPLFRLEALLSLIETIPDAVTVELFGYAYVATFDEALSVLARLARSLARLAATAAPVVLVKLTLFALLVFSLLLEGSGVRRAVLAVVPLTYRDVAEAFHRRTRETLFAIYVLQAATAVGTFLLAVPVFTLLDYQLAFTLATLAGLLQFIPIVGPSLLLALLAGYSALVGDLPRAALTLLVGGFVIAWLPDILIRPRLAAETADLPGSLYFVGFVGGLLSLGPVGIIAGPLVVALVVEAARLLSAELNDVPVDED